MKSFHAHEGFTLVELSIVLVIIGLIIGSILVGRDLIHAAEIRATVSQIEKYNSAANTFRNKYGGLPGDLSYDKAAQLGFFAFTGANAGKPGYGDGNGLINAAGGGGGFAGEVLVFWRHLSDAKLINGNYGTTGSAALVTTTGTVTADMTTGLDQVLPASRMGITNFISVYAGLNPGDAGHNFYEFLPTNDISPGGSGNALSGVVSVDAYVFDQKTDDGLPNSGRVLATFQAGMDSFPPVWQAAPGGDSCTYGGTSGSDSAARYNVTSATPLCGMQVQASF